LRNTQIPLAEVAIQLGFSEPSTFFRAFRRWEGATPGQYREAT
jgi:AraC-like DNA-binding protein